MVSPTVLLIYLLIIFCKPSPLQLQQTTMASRDAALALLLAVACLLCFGDLASSAPGTLPPSEIQALKAIAAELKIGSDVWDFSVNPCDGSSKWVNVSAAGRTADVISNLTCGDCDSKTNVCHVVSIILRSMNLTGTLPSNFSDLPHLTILDLNRNVISGSIPPSLGSLPLANLSLLGNRLSGPIPDTIGNISTLLVLNLENNLLGGSIPGSLGNLQNISRILLSANNFIGQLPESLGKLTALTDFRIDGNGISGNIPSFIGNWASLRRLDMQGTSLEGAFPPSFSKLRLTELRVSDFKGDGTFPPIEGMDFRFLTLRNCSISGPLPDYIGKLGRAVDIDLSFNNFIGEIPSSFQPLMQNSVLFMYLSHNKLNGTIPSWILGNRQIDLSYNFFSEPKTLTCEDTHLNLVSSFSSTMDNSVTSCLRKNLPCSGKATNYQLFINCGGESVSVDGNDYAEDRSSSGESRYFSPNPNWAYSSSGVFVGNSNSRYVVANASALNITNPQLYMSARTAASSLKYYGFCLQKGNYTVKLHFAEILFTNDQTFPSVGRRFFDVFIQGQKVLEDFNIAETAKGAGREIVKSFNASVDTTLEIHLRWSGKGTNAIPDRGVYGPLISAISVTPNFVPVTNKKEGLSGAEIAGVVIASCVLIFLIVVVLWILVHKKDTENEELKHLKLQGAYFSLREIKAATKNFDPLNKIGEGGFGAVFKGVLPDGTTVAVKQLSSKSQQGNREFVNEMGTMAALTHPNLVKLFGCCIEGNQLLLIYEYMENNSLARALYGSEKQRLNLVWKTRRKIALHVARGLAYLHEESRLKIVHRDIKPTNVLLDKELNAKISDFGLAKLDDADKTHINTRIAGTIGYIAPEYATRGHLTEKADVYSFGIVMLEMVSGQCNANYATNIPDNYVYLLDRAYMLQEQGKLLELVDPNLGSDYSTTEAERMLNLALACTNLSPALRPTMTLVVSIIEGGAPIPLVVPRPIRSAASPITTGRTPLENLHLDTEEASGAWIDTSVITGSPGDTSTQSMSSRLIQDGLVR